MPPLGDTDLTVSEIAGVLATIAGVDRDEISAWMIGVQLHRHLDDGCHELTAVLSSLSTNTGGPDGPGETRLIANMLDSLADRWEHEDGQ